MKDQSEILIVDDDIHIADLLAVYFADQGWGVTRSGRMSEAISQLAQKEFDAILVDFQLPDGDGLQVIKHIRKTDPHVPIIFMTGHGSVDTAVAAMQAGAFEYLGKPLNMDEVLIKTRNALELTALRRNLRMAQAELAQRESGVQIVGRSDAMRSVMRSARIAARSEVDSILVTGESGVGKNLIARAIHEASQRRDQPFVEITCTALPDQLLESELFGHERGAFTDARSAKEGLLETAHRGTAFLDEIGDMSISLQAKMLGFLESRRVRRVGSNRERAVDVRIVAASNQDLHGRAKQKLFREDLLYRLNVIVIHVPPLRDRPDDIPLMAMHFVKVFAQKQGSEVRSIAPDALRVMMGHPWPGNVRQLRNAIERAVVFSSGQELTLASLPSEISERQSTATTLKGPETVEAVRPGKSLAEIERDLVLNALKECRGNQTEAAKLLGISRNQMVYRVKKFGFRRMWGSE